MAWDYERRGSFGNMKQTTHDLFNGTLGVIVTPR